ncbi:FadR/GntR family transcriptional regulator [Pollutibacter soli]|uniref:FadR/GntR family transcriptional regulator n=1 Tax=Pollutibacter soli TaxID=3034157 RepID=UPI003013977A
MQTNGLSNDLERIAHKTMADIVEIRLRDFLKKKAFKPGDALPKEIELAESLGVSRNVVREALSRLRMLGMIETKRKRGMVLASPDIMGSFERVLDPMFINENTLRDIFELRLTLEMGLADLLYLRMKKEDVDELEEIAKNQKITAGQHSFRIKNEIAFHGKLYTMTGNDTLQRFQNMLLPIFGYLVSLEKVPIIGKVSHLDLVNILRKGGKEDFRQGMFLHLEHHFKKLK